MLKTVRDPLGEPNSRDTRIAYDPFDLLPTSVTDPVGLVTEARYDTRVLQPREVSDPNANRTRFTYTPLGLLAQVAVMGKPGEPVGDSDEVPGTRFEYDLRAVVDRDQPASVRTIRRVHHLNDGDVPLLERDETVEAVEYSDGFGRLLQTRALAEDVMAGDTAFGGEVLSPDQSQDPGPIILRRLPPGAKPNVTVSGAQIYDDKGRVVEKFESYFDSGFDYRPAGANQLGQKATLFYDPLGRVIRSRNPDGSEQRVVFGVPGSIAAQDLSEPDRFEPTPWEAYTYDENDNAGRTHPAEAAAYSHHWNTPSSVRVDALGRAVEGIVRNGPDPAIDWFVTRSTYDIRGNLISVTDALGRLAFQHTYDLANNAVRIENIDAGVRRIVLDGAGNEVERRDSKGALVLQAYDLLHRPIRLWARDDAGSAPTLRQRLEYGDSGSPDQDPSLRDDNRSLNRLGVLNRHYDEAGLLELEAYDFKGNILEKSRRMIRDDAILRVFPTAADGPAPDWNIRAFRVDWDLLDVQELLDDRRHQISATYDALGRVKSLLYPRDVGGNRKELRQKYNRKRPVSP